MITGGSMNGATPSVCSARPSQLPRDQTYRASGSAIATESAAAQDAMISECRSGSSQSPSWNRAPYQRSDSPSGGKRRLRPSFSEIPVTTMIGRASRKRMKQT